MKRSQLKRTAPLKNAYLPKRRVVLSSFGKSETAAIKKRIQGLLRDIVILRDGGCIFRDLLSHHCNGFANDGHLILQADHLITRGNSATYADSRLVVCVCMGAHGWKSVGRNIRKAQYDALVKTVISPERVALWQACEEDSWKPTRTGSYDWLVAEVALQAELNALQGMIEL